MTLGVSASSTNVEQSNNAPVSSTFPGSNQPSVSFLDSDHTSLFSSSSEDQDGCTSATSNETMFNPTFNISPGAFPSVQGKTKKTDTPTCLVPIMGPLAAAVTGARSFIHDEKRSKKLLQVLIKINNHQTKTMNKGIAIRLKTNRQTMKILLKNNQEETFATNIH